MKRTILTPADSTWLSETLARNAIRFGGWRMEDEGSAPPSGEQSAPKGEQSEEGAGDQGKGGKDAVLADLAKERKARQDLATQLADLTMAQDAQRDAFAKALGLKPEETSDADKLTQQLTSLSEQFAASQRKATLLEVAAEHQIPAEYHHLLTATETEALQAQAKSVATLVAATAAASGTPGFASPAGQGQGNDSKPSLQDQLAAAEKALAGKTRGTPEHREAQQRLMNLKSQQLFAAQQTAK